MNNSDYISGFLAPTTQRAYAEKKAGANEEAREAPTQGVLTREMLTRIKRIVLGPSVTTIEQVSDRFESLLDGLDDDEKKDESK